MRRAGHPASGPPPFSRPTRTNEEEVHERTAEIELPEDGQSLPRLVLKQWGRVLSFVVSFLVIGQFWIAHHGMFGHIRRFDYGLLWLNLIALLTISFMPFPTAVLGARLDADDQFPVVFYAASMTVSSVVLTLTWLYARNRRLVDATLGSGELKSFTMRAVVTSVVFLISIGAAFAGLLPAALCWLLMLPAARLAARRLSG